MLNQEEREMLIKIYENTHDAKMTAEIFGVHEKLYMQEFVIIKNAEQLNCRYIIAEERA